MGIESRLSRLEGLAEGIAAEAREEEKLRRQRAITRMILDEFARLKASGELSAEDPLAHAVRNVAHDQYGDVQSPAMCDEIADAWIATIKDWTRLDWLVNAGRDGPPRA